MTREGGFSGVVRLIARDGRMYSLAAFGESEDEAREFVESFQLHAAGFAERAAKQWDVHIEAMDAHRKAPPRRRRLPFWRPPCGQ